MPVCPRADSLLGEPGRWTESERGGQRLEMTTDWASPVLPAWCHSLPQSFTHSTSMPWGLLWARLPSMIVGAKLL